MVDVNRITGMPRGLGTVQVGLLTFLYVDRSTERLELTDDALGGSPFAWPIFMLDDKPRGPGTDATAKHRSQRSINRRAVYAMETRGLLSTGTTTDDWRAPQLQMQISKAGIDYVSTHPNLLGRAHAVRHRLTENKPTLSRAEVVGLCRRPTILGDAEHYRRYALDQVGREIDLDNIEDLAWAFYRYFGFDPIPGTTHPADDAAVFELARTEVAHPFLMSLLLYRSLR